MTQLVTIGAVSATWTALPCCTAFASAESGPTGTAVEKKYAFAQLWIRRFMDTVDQELDVKTRNRLMEAMGRRCCSESQAEALQEYRQIGLEGLIKRMKQQDPDQVIVDGKSIHFQYTQNAAGLRTADGFCLCPLVEKGPEGLSATFCQCSIGYVARMFEAAAGVPVKVELLESVKRGGEKCRFVVHV